MNTQWKLLGLGFIGGMIPLTAYLLVSTPRYERLSDEVIDGNRYAQTVGYEGNPAVGPNFVDA